MDEEYVKKLVVLRLKTILPEVGFSIGTHGSFTRDELIAEVEKGSTVGKAVIEMELNFVRKQPSLAKRF
ncbi:MAG: hypothetical protein Q7R47_02045 [Candidatus Diapherotrites archaeon]|nr:hypothetical protein [Candidatus Diapherotrites archaeon]